MPNTVERTHNFIQYPTGCKELSEEITKVELLQRLKAVARAFQDMGQEDEHVSQFSQLSLYLATEFFLDHSSKDVRLLAACCIADVFRIFAPEAPYKDADQLKGIFLFLTQQLRGLENTEAPNFKRYFYLLENLAWVKSFNICFDHEDNQEIFCVLFRVLFTVVNEKHSNKVTNFMLDIMCPLITEADTVSQELLDIILQQIIEPYKTQNRFSYNLARDLIKRTSNAMEPYIQTFFNNTLMLGKTASSDLSGNLYEVIYQLNLIEPPILLAVLPQLEFKLKSNEEHERKRVTLLLSEMFSNPDSELADLHKPLWLCFLGRFNDIDTTVRRTCVKSCQNFIINHPNLVKDIAEHLRQRQHDPDENVRTDVVQSIVNAAKKDLKNVSDELLECVKERTLDKKLKIRKEALTGLGQIYKKLASLEHPDVADMDRMEWIRNKILYAYYQTSINDRVTVERILNTALVPYSLDPDERMRRFYHLYGSVDEPARKALQEVFKSQLTLRSLTKSILEIINHDVDNSKNQMLLTRMNQLSKNLPEPLKAYEYIKKFVNLLQDTPRLRSFLIKVVSPDCTCKKAEECVKEILKKMGNPIPQNYLYSHIKTLMERIAPVMIDTVAITSLVKLIEKTLSGLGPIVEDLDDPTEKGMRLLVMLSIVFPGSFDTVETLKRLLNWVASEHETVSDLSIQVFYNIGQKLELAHPEIHKLLVPLLVKHAKYGSPKQAKHSIRCIQRVCRSTDETFKQIFEHLEENMDLESPNFLTALVAMGHIGQMCPGQFGSPIRSIVSNFVVKELIVQERHVARKTTESWYSDNLVSEETQAKIQGLKLMVRWILGVKSNEQQIGTRTLHILYTLLLHEGDLTQKGNINKAEMARLRLQAASSILKIAQEPCYTDLITLQQFQCVALTLNDPCYQVRLQFGLKLHKALMSLKLPLQYMSIFCLGANDPIKERKQLIKQFLVTNINRRRDFIKQNINANNRKFLLLPDYVLPYAIHLLAHDPDLESIADVENLKNIRECLWFIMEPLITKNESYSYNFYKRLIENIKQTRDIIDPEDEKINEKLYAVCDLSLGLVMTKTANFVLKDFPAEPVLPAKLFTKPDQSYQNLKIYLPKELQSYAPGKPGVKPSHHPLGGSVRLVTSSGAVPKDRADTVPLADNLSNISSSPEHVSVEPKKSKKPAKRQSPKKPTKKVSPDFSEISLSSGVESDGDSTIDRTEEFVIHRSKKSPKKQFSQESDIDSNDENQAKKFIKKKTKEFPKTSQNKKAKAVENSSVKSQKFNIDKSSDTPSPPKIPRRPGRPPKNQGKTTPVAEKSTPKNSSTDSPKFFSSKSPTHKSLKNSPSTFSKKFKRSLSPSPSSAKKIKKSHVSSSTLKPLSPTKNNSQSKTNVRITKSKSITDSPNKLDQSSISGASMKSQNKTPDTGSRSKRNRNDSESIFESKSKIGSSKNPSTPTNKEKTSANNKNKKKQTRQSINRSVNGTLNGKKTPDNLKSLSVSGPRKIKLTPRASEHSLSVRRNK